MPRNGVLSSGSDHDVRRVVKAFRAIEKETGREIEIKPGSKLHLLDCVYLGSLPLQHFEIEDRQYTAVASRIVVCTRLSASARASAR